MESINTLIKSLIESKKTMVSEERFETVLRNYEKINSIDGDIVECGTWQGGFSIFLSLLFKNRNVWVCDSFDGFQPPENGLYAYTMERHTPAYHESIRVGLEEVKQNFKLYDLESDKRISFVKGFVKDTLNPATCPIQKIALLRIDVDAYSATREVLEYLYPKVSVGGFIIFDDSCLYESSQAIKDYYRDKNIPLELRHPVLDIILKSAPKAYDKEFPCGCYTIKI